MGDPVLQQRTLLFDLNQDCFARWRIFAICFICCSWPKKHSTEKNFFPRLLCAAQSPAMPLEVQQRAAEWESFWARNKEASKKLSRGDILAAARKLSQCWLRLRCVQTWKLHVTGSYRKRKQVR